MCRRRRPCSRELAGCSRAHRPIPADLLSCWREHLALRAGVPPLRGKGHSATGGVCRFLASSRAEMCSSFAQTRGATGWGRTLAAWRGQVSALPAAGTEASRKPALLSGSPSHSPTAGGRSAEGSGPGAVGVSQPKVERTRMRRWPELRRFLREWRRYIWDPARVHVPAEYGFRPTVPDRLDHQMRQSGPRQSERGSAAQYLHGIRHRLRRRVGGILVSQSRTDS